MKVQTAQSGMKDLPDWIRLLEQCIIYLFFSDMLF